MMNPMRDVELLDRYTMQSDRGALDEVVRRHIGFVYAAALRQTRDPHEAEDVTQAVFIVLARRAGAIRDDAALPAWLFSVTRFAAASARRLEQRRARHERRAASEMPAMSSHHDSTRHDLLTQLDDAIARLSESDRRGVLLSYFQNKTFREVGAAMGISEEAARKRVTRAVERMRRFFAERGENVSGTALASMMTSQALVSAPPHLVAPAANVAIIAQSFTCNAIARGVGKMLLWSTLKPLAAAAAALVLVSGVVVGQVALRQGAGESEKSQAAAVESGGDAVDLGEGVRLELLAIAPIDSDDWNTPAGAPAGNERVNEALQQLQGASVVLSPPATHRAIVRVTAPPDVNLDLNVSNSPATGAAHGQELEQPERVFIVHFVAPKDSKSADFQLRAATGPWKTVVDNDNNDNDFQGTWGVAEGGVVFAAMRETDGKPCVFVATELTKQPWRVVAFDDADNVLGAHGGNETSAGRLSTCQAVFETDRLSIKRLEVQTRPYNLDVTCAGCTLDPKHPTTPKIVPRKTR